MIPGQPVAKFDVCLGAGLLDAFGDPLSPTEFSIRGHLIVSRANTISIVQDDLDQWLGYVRTANTVSVAMAIDMDPTLGGLVEWCIPTIEDGYGPIDVAGATYFGARLNLSVSAR